MLTIFAIKKIPASITEYVYSQIPLKLLSYINIIRQPVDIKKPCTQASNRP